MKRENELKVWEYLRTCTKVKEQYQANEFLIAQAMFDCKVRFNNLDKSKFYVSEMYRTVFLEFESKEDIEEWVEFCKKHVFYSFYNPLKVIKPRSD